MPLTIVIDRATTISLCGSKVIINILLLVHISRKISPERNKKARNIENTHFYSKPKLWINNIKYISTTLTSFPTKSIRVAKIISVLFAKYIRSIVVDGRIHNCVMLLKYEGVISKIRAERLGK
jgi:hypothetical protein